MTRIKKTVSKVWYTLSVLDHFDHLTFTAVFLSHDMQKGQYYVTALT